MTADVVMPRLSDSMEEGTILTWMKGLGDTVAVGEEIVEIETDKASMTYESDIAGTLTEIVAQAGETLPVGAVIARIGIAGGKPGVAAAVQVEPDTAGENSASISDPPPHRPQTKQLRVKASPLARRLARDTGVDLTVLEGTGPGRRIVKRDVEAAAPAGGASSPAGLARETVKGSIEVVELTRLQQTVARRMSEAKATVPHFHLETVIDMSRAVEARGRIKALAAEGEIMPSLNDLAVKGCALALKEFPKANGSYRDGRVELHSRVNIGIAVAAQGALVVPTLFDADKKGLRQIASESHGLARRVRDEEITPPEVAGGTFTISNLGMLGVRNFAAVINCPQAAILGIGAIEERPVVRDGEVISAQLMNVTLACDHRVLYGAEGARFLMYVKSLLEEPLALAL